MTKTIKIMLIIGAIILFGFILYYFLSSGSDTESSKIVKSTDVSNPQAPTNSEAENATAFLSTLLSLNKIKIDRSIFENPVFSRLQDNTVPISNDGGVVGRANPFAQIDGQSSNDPSIAFPQISTGANTTTPVAVPVR